MLGEIVMYNGDKKSPTVQNLYETVERVITLIAWCLYNRRLYSMKLKNGLDLQVEKALISDAGAILEYLNKVGGESDNLLFGENEFKMTVADEEQFIKNMENSKTSALFVGKIDEKVICLGSIMSPPRARIAHQAEIAISVKKEFWGLGIGSELMETMISFAKENKQTEIIHLGVKADNEVAQNLYKKLGFIEIGRFKNFFKIQDKYFDEILMNLYL